MVFSSFVFLLAFLPIVLLLYYLCPARLRNLVLLAFSLVFYPVFGEQECARMREAIWHAEDLDNALDIWPRTLARHIEE